MRRRPPSGQSRALHGPLLLFWARYRGCDLPQAPLLRRQQGERHVHRRTQVFRFISTRVSVLRHGLGWAARSRARWGRFRLMSGHRPAPPRARPRQGPPPLHRAQRGKRLNVQRRRARKSVRWPPPRRFFRHPVLWPGLTMSNGAASCEPRGWRRLRRPYGREMWAQSVVFRVSEGAACPRSSGDCRAAALPIPFK